MDTFTAEQGSTKKKLTEEAYFVQSRKKSECKTRQELLLLLQIERKKSASLIEENLFLKTRLQELSAME